MVSANKRDPSLEGGNSTEIGVMWTLKHDISSPKFYELLIKIELKVYAALYLNNCYYNTKICLNTVTRLREDLLPAYQSIRRHSELSEYFIPDHDHPYYYLNTQTYNFLER